MKKVCECIFDLTNRETEKGKLLFEACEEKHGGVEKITSDNAAFFFGDDKQVPFVYELKIKLVNGKTKKTNMVATYCPTCGLDKNGEPAEVSK